MPAIYTAPGNGVRKKASGLLRRCYPDGTELSVHAPAKLDAVARQLNERPDKTL